MSEYTRLLPVVALRNMAVMPGMLIHFDVNRKMSMEAIEEAMLNDQQIMLVAQIDSEVDNPAKTDLYEMGTVAEIKQMMKLPGNVLRVLVTGLERAKLEEIVSEEPFLKASITIEKDEVVAISDLEKEGMLRGLRHVYRGYCDAHQEHLLKKELVRLNHLL